MRSHLLRLFIGVIVLTVAAAPALCAQQMLTGEGNPVPIGFNYRGSAQRGADGAVRFTDFPVVTVVDSGSAPQTAGIAAGDVIIEVNGQDGRDAGLFRVRTPGTKYSVVVRRATDTRQIDWVIPEPAPKP